MLILSTQKDAASNLGRFRHVSKQNFATNTKSDRWYQPLVKFASNSGQINAKKFPMIRFRIWSTTYNRSLTLKFRGHDVAYNDDNDAEEYQMADKAK